MIDGCCVILSSVGAGFSAGVSAGGASEGFASAGLDSFPSTLKWDAYSGDYGPNFVGHSLNAATYLIDHPDFGWQAFGGNVSRRGDWVRVEPRDSYRMRLYVAPTGLWLTLDAGTFEAVEFNTKTRAIRVGLSAATSDAPTGRLRIQQPALLKGVGSYLLATRLTAEHGGYAVPLGNRTTTVELKLVSRRYGSMP